LNPSFFWYRDRHENPIDEWHIRRYTAFFTGWASIVGIVLAQLISLLVICGFDFGMTTSNYVWIFCSFLLILGLIVNGMNAMRNALQALDLWIAGATNPRFRSVLNKIHPLDNNHEKAA
jgi:hypothetical protein